MTLSSMVVSRDWQEISVLECILASLHMDVSVEEQPQRAWNRLNKSKIDALIVDCDLNGTAQFLRELHRDQQRASTVPLVIMGGPNSHHNLDATGAVYAFDKPISVEQAVRTLSAARNMILDGRLRYHRAGLQVPVSVAWNSHKQLDAYLVNISQGGVQVHLLEPVEITRPFRIKFELPGTTTPFQARAEVAWQDKQGNVGVRFVQLSHRQQRGLQLWLAQQYFAS
jgi:CheY-like chemotaxis protein